VFFETDEGLDDRLIALDSTGKIVGHFGRLGAGPGEVRGRRPVAVTTNRILLWDSALLRFSEWSFRGELQRTIVSKQVFAPLVQTSHGILGIQVASAAAAIVITRIDSVALKPLLEASDTFSVAPRLENVTSAR